MRKDAHSERGRPARVPAGSRRSAIRCSLAIALTAGLAAGCAPSRPPIVEIMVSTAPPGASCVLTRLGQPIATAEPTPAIARVEPGGGEIGILCRRPAFADAGLTLPAQATQPADYS